ncbi:DUF1302 family protein [Glaciimonas sp. PCH181]|uniref:DUF1302 family protein n=1 Tax=Glaciimonas sp. PCH181 TaxID=2133943 RepID=UPI00191C625E|nr:DUF1302 family protein [Glaciimonas sp. PCH181]
MGGKGKLMMARGSIELAADFRTGPITWRAVGRADRELITSYEKNLQDRSCYSATIAGSPTGPGCSVRGQYDQEELREFYADFKVGERVTVRLGKQQVVFGETDFFHPNDLLHGFDYRWRLFGEPESDELRKPLIMANVKIAIPEAQGTLQVVVRPGWDRNKDIGNTYDIYGGRWSGSPNMGVDYLAYATQFNYDHPSGRAKDVTGALRWSGEAGSLNYAVGYQRVFQPDFVLNPCGVFAGAAQRDSTGCVKGLYYQQAPTNKAYGDWIYPIIDVLGFSVSAESKPLDAILNFELAYQFGRLFNSNSNVSGTPNTGGFFQIPNNAGVMGPIVKKDVIQTTFRVDKQLRLQNWFGTNGPSFASAQIFDTWIQNFNNNDDAVAAVSSAAKLRKHSTIGTAFIQFPYMNSRLTYQVAAGAEFQARNAFLIPSVSYNIGNHWRLSADAVFFYSQNARTNNISDPGNQSSGFAALNNHNYATLRATYQF